MKTKVTSKVNRLRAGFFRVKEGLAQKMKDLIMDESGMGTVEVILIIVGICIADKSRILCGNFRCI